MVTAIMNEEEIYVNQGQTHRHHHHQFRGYVGGPNSSATGGSSSVGGSSGGSGPYTSYNSPVLGIKSSGRMTQNHHYHIAMDTSCSGSASSVTTTTESTRLSGNMNGGSSQSKQIMSAAAQSFDGNGNSHHGGGGISSKSSFREIIEMLLYCYLEYGGTVRSEEFKNLVEVFLCPIFEPLHFPTNRSNSNSGSSSSQTSSAAMGTTCCVVTCSPSTSSSLASSTTSSPSSAASPPALSSSCGTSDCGSSCSRLLQGDVLSCPSCYGIFIEPVTIPCGHTYCKKCLHKEVVGQCCRLCTHVLTSGDVSQCKTNVLVGSLVEKWWPKEVTATDLRNQGNALFQKRLVDEALAKYSQALNLSPEDHLSLGNRSHALLTAGKSEEALQDAEAATKYCPAWPKGYFRKSAALISLGRYEEAFLSLTLCMYLIKISASSLAPPLSASSSSTAANSASTSSPSCSSSSPVPCTKSSEYSREDPARTQVINEIIKILQKIFLQTTNAAVGSILKRHNTGDQVQFTPYPNNGRKCCGRHHHERRRSSGFTREWNNDSEYTSSGDESDNQPSSPYISATGSTDSNKVYCWKSSQQRVQYPSCMNHHNHNHHHHHGHGHGHGHVHGHSHPHLGQHKNYVSPSITSNQLVDQLSARMNRLLVRASQDLKSFELRLKAQQQQKSSTVRQVDSKLISTNDLECSLCYRLLFQPVSTGCGHTFCRSCLERCLDHNPACPLCKTSLQNYLASRDHAITDFLEVSISHYLPKEREERLNQHLEELNSAAVPPEGKNSVDVDIPVFVCTMAFPTIPCPLHVFEPRYRLMIRRCMENGSNRFGMCCYLAEGEHNYGEIGTMLEIKNIQYFADGRSVVDTVGCRRFRVIRKSMVDGYNAAKIELLHDQPVENDEIPVVTALHDKVFKEAFEWLQSIGQVRRQRILSHFGLMPSPEENWLDSPDGPSWIWWLLAILPLDSKAQLSILSMCSLQKRLECILKVLTFVKSRMGSIANE